MARPRLSDEERKARIQAKNKRYYEENKTKWANREPSPPLPPVEKAKRLLAKLQGTELDVIQKELQQLTSVPGNMQ